MPDGRKPTQENIGEDQKQLRDLLQAAIDVELFTIPLYMSALYSIQGFTELKVDAGMLWPARSPQLVESVEPDEQATQKAFNIVYSVYIQEMFHLQLAGNIAKAVGVDISLEPPIYDGGPNIPCVGNLDAMRVKGRGTPYKGVRVRLGPVDDNQVKLFMAIEEPDWDVDRSTMPDLPLAQPVGETTFGSIGHLYAAITWYINLQYSDGSYLWNRCYEEPDAGQDALQLDAFRAGDDEEYRFRVTFGDCSDPDEARSLAIIMISAIVEEGEGGRLVDISDGGRAVPRRFQPKEEILKEFAIKHDLPGMSGQVQAIENSESHFERFKKLAADWQQVRTWPKWLASHGPWQPADFICKGGNPTPAQQQQAKLRAAAYNDPQAITELDKRLNLTFVSLLDTIAEDWNDRNKPSQSFPIWAMLGVSSRVKALWAAGGHPTFLKVDKPLGELHACQGLDPEHPGKNTCATAVDHTCAKANSCNDQGGCGYPYPNDAARFQGPGVNEGAGNGGCGSPIPTSQRFFANMDPFSYDDVDMNPGDLVWEKAWDIFQKRYPKAELPKDWAATSVRLVLPPS